VQDEAPLVLVVEDEPQMCTLLQDLLEPAGYRVECATDARGGLARIAAGGVDLVLLDRMLPGGDGLELCRQVRARETDLYLPMLMMTALAGRDARLEGFAAGADDYIAKPFDAQELLDRVGVWARARLRMKSYHGRLVEAYGRLRTVDRQREEFLALVSHELRQPVAAIAVMADALAEAPALGEPELAALDSLRRQAHGLGRLADDLLAIARLETGLFRLQRTTVELGALVAALAEHALEPARVQVELPPEPVLVDVDPERLGQALDNLLRNALKYSAADLPVVVAVCPTPTEARIEVRDQGIGLTAEEVARLFQKYQRLGSGRPSAASGVGLGLYLARLLVESHGGRIGATSAGPGHGATFTITLPRAQPPAEGTA
jgi:two-component system, sensor histidine kinase